MNVNSRRLSILTKSEIDDLYGLPRLSDDDRSLFFDLSVIEQKAVDAVYARSSAVHLILQIGYFKAKQQFFVYGREAVLGDLHYILQRYFPDQALDKIKTLSKPTRLEQQQIILQLFDYRLCDGEAKAALEQKAQRVAMLSTQPIYILRETLQYLTNQRLIAPGYTYLQDMVSRVVTGERRRITSLLVKAMTPDVDKQLEALLESEEGMYRISLLKHEPKDFSYRELRQEVDRRKFFQPLYEFGQSFLGTAGLSNESIKYYASLVPFYSVYKLRRMAEPTTRLYLLCFAFHRFRQINDNLIEALICLIGQYEKQAKLAADEAMQQAINEAGANLQAAGQVLELFIDNSIPDETPFAAIKEKAFELLNIESFPVVSGFMRNIEFDKTAFEWSYYGTLRHKFKLNLRHLFCNLDFVCLVSDEPLLEAILFLQELLRQGKTPRQMNPANFPTGIIAKNLQRYLYTRTEEQKKKTLEVDRYEFLVYRELRKALEACDVFVRDSNEFRSFDDDLINAERWNKDKDAILQEIGAPILLTPIQDTLAALKRELEAKYKSVNQRIESGDNKHIKITGSGDKLRWTLVYPSEEEPTNSPFYGQLPSIGVADLLWFVAERTGFLKSFAHVLERYVKQDADPKPILACIVAMGTNMGLWKMAEVSGLSHSALLTTARNFLRAETLHAANDAISNATAALPVFQAYDIHHQKHSSSDGQHIVTQIDTINARHSSKFFALKKGVNSITLSMNHIPINAKIIGAHEHESHFVFDILYNNTTEIKPERHSTDTHGTNQVNFFILRVFGYQFSPRYRDLHKKIDSLVGFQHPNRYGDALFKPSRKAFDTLICKEWPNIQRILASLAQKDVTQATIVRKLASYKRQNQTKKALWELDNIYRSLHILDFIDDPILRQRIQKALNRGEAYHRMRRAISYVNAGKFRVKTEAEQQIWNDCSRLIANAIIHYNTLILSRVYEQKLAADDQDAIEIIKGTSPVAWQNVNLIGKFEFTKENAKVDIDALAARYNDPDFWRKSVEGDGVP
ncbi:MAG: Tn3 family transposase [Methylomonas sp.]|nr:Tn3 family transposase [Methylomonas sp.]